MTNYPSILLGKAVDQFASLPGIGRKTALRLVLHLLRQPEKDVEAFTSALTSLKQDVHYCRICHTVSDQEVCPICQAHSRDKHTVCVVENVQDVMSIENTGQYQGLYHVLGGVISPMDGVGPSDLEIDSLVARIEPEEIREVILALPTTMEGDTTNFYIFRRLAPYPDVKITMLARGVSGGNEIEYTDELTLGRSIINRTLFSDSFQKQ